MRTPYAVALVLVIMLAGFQLYSTVGAVCNVPVEWRIGELDERFGITEAEARSVVEEASSIWENATDRNLFSYTQEADFTINFVFDERQRAAIEAAALEADLNQKESANEALNVTYAELVSRYETTEASFLSAKSAFENRLAAYNQKVASYNNQGGAPPEVYEELEAEKNALDREQQELSRQVGRLNALGEEINRLGERGNKLVAEYNEEVGKYNEEYGYREGVTQGDYQGDRINIYKFETINELRLVLAHELGHALSLDHVDGSTSIMYYLMGDQPLENTALSEHDLSEFGEICGAVSTDNRLRTWLSGVF
ncbi:MAG: matrixin family metalloprotease [Candidatus Paceibacterota bacterium]